MQNLVIIARSEAKDSLQERLERTQACIEAGADASWVSARTEEEILAYAKLGKPLVGVPPRGVMTIQRYGELGGRVGCIPTVLQVAMLHGMRQCLEELKKSGTEAAYFKNTPGIDDTRKWYANWVTPSSKSWKRSTAIKQVLFITAIELANRDSKRLGLFMLIARNTLRGIIFAVVLFARLAQSARAQLTKINVGYSAISGDALPAWLAKDAGIFEKNGLDVQPVFFTGGTTAVMALVSADTPIAQLAGPAVVNSVMAGSDATIDRRRRDFAELLSARAGRK